MTRARRGPGSAAGLAGALTAGAGESAAVALAFGWAAGVDGLAGFCSGTITGAVAGAATGVARGGAIRAGDGFGEARVSTGCPRSATPRFARRARAVSWMRLPF